MAPERNGDQSTDRANGAACGRRNGERVPDTARPPLDGRPRLDVVTVAYEDQPDRCTLLPSECDGAELLTTWLSVDRAALCSLAAWR